MAEITIRLRDAGDQVDIRIEIDPPVGEDDPETPAQYVAGRCLQVIREVMEGK
jgi:hypothetical protein